MKKLLTLTACALALAAVSPAFAGNYGDKAKTYGEKTMHKKAKADIVDTAAANEDFSTLVAAVKAAGLVDTLKGEGPFTVFAPTNAAFAALPAGTLDDLLKPENKEKLAGILTYHVVPGKIKARDIASGETKVATAQGQKAKIAKTDSGVTIDNANIVKADIKTKNGVIHVIDAVILPQ